MSNSPLLGPADHFYGRSLRGEEGLGLSINPVDRRTHHQLVLSGPRGGILALAISGDPEKELGVLLGLLRESYGELSLPGLKIQADNSEEQRAGRLCFFFGKGLRQSRSLTASRTDYAGMLAWLEARLAYCRQA